MCPHGIFYPWARWEGGGCRFGNCSPAAPASASRGHFRKFPGASLGVFWGLVRCFHVRVGVFRVGGDDFRLDLKGFSPNLASWMVFCCSQVGYLCTSEVNFAAHKLLLLISQFISETFVVIHDLW